MKASHHKECHERWSYHIPPQGCNSIDFKNLTKSITNFLSKSYGKEIKKPEEINILYMSPLQIGLSWWFSRCFKVYWIATQIFIIHHVSDLLIVVNSSVNFVIYCFVEQSFRQELASLLGMFARRGSTGNVVRGRWSSRSSRQVKSLLSSWCFQKLSY